MHGGNPQCTEYVRKGSVGTQLTGEEPRFSCAARWPNFPACRDLFNKGGRTCQQYLQNNFRLLKQLAGHFLLLDCEWHLTRGFLPVSAGELQPCDQSSDVSAFDTLLTGPIHVLNLDTTGRILGMATA